MIAIILAGAAETRLEIEVEDACARNDLGYEFASLKGLPKALFPVGDNGEPMLAHWLKVLSNGGVNESFIVTAASKYKHFERFATSNGIGVEYVVNNGVTGRHLQLGSARDLVLGLRRAEKVLGKQVFESHSLMILAGDSLFYKSFDALSVINFSS